MFRRFIRWLFKRYQLMLLEPEGGHTARNMHVNIAAVLLVLLIVALGGIALGWYFSPGSGVDLSTRYYQLQQKNHDLADQLATREGELSVAREQIKGLKGEIQDSEQQIEDLKKSKHIYDSILQARMLKGVRILRATAHIEDDDLVKGGKKVTYSIVLVKGGNYPRHVAGSVHATAYGPDGQSHDLRLGKDSDDLSYQMDTHAFLEGSVPWKQDWMPVKLLFTRMNSKGMERDQMEVKLDGNDT